MRTFYKIFDENGKVVFVNRNTACFYELAYGTMFGFYDLSKTYEYLKNKYIEILIDPILTIEEINQYVAGLESFFGRYTVLSVDKQYIEEAGSEIDDGADYEHSREWHVYKKEILDTKYKIRFHFNDFECFNYIKLAVYLVRGLMENSSWLKEFLKIPQPENLDYYQWIRIGHSPGHIPALPRTGHNYFCCFNDFGREIHHNPPFESVKELLKNANEDRFGYYIASISGSYQFTGTASAKLQDAIKQSQVKYITFYKKDVKTEQEKTKTTIKKTTKKLAKTIK